MNTTTSSAKTDPTNAEEIRRNHFKHEASVRSVGLLFCFAAVLLALAAIAAAVGNKTANTPGRLAVTTVLIAVGLGQFAVGIGLRKLKSWARIPAAILSAIGLLAFPLGTLINAYVLFLLLSKKGSVVFSKSYTEIISATHEIRYKTSIIVWILLALLILLLGIGEVGLLMRK